MNQKRLTFLVVFSIVSIIFLIGIQLYWIRTAVDTQQRKFDQTVMEVMQNVIKKVEREEAVTKVTSSIFGGQMINTFFGQDSALKVDPKNKDDKSIIDDQSAVGTKNDMLRIQFTPPPVNDSTFLIIRETKKNVLSSSINQSNSKNPKDSLLKNEIRKKSSLINNIVNELALISVSRDFGERISYEKIDSLFAKELKSKGIKTDYIFDVYDVESNSLNFSEDKELNSELKETPYRYQLFQNDFIESDSILLYFPNQDQYVLKNSWKVLVISFLLVCILILIFYSSISTIYKQKKLSQVKNDFINNMTHELKTPISTISLACEALSDNSLVVSKDQQSSYVNMIQDENKRLSVLVDNVLKSATWDSSKLKLDLKKHHLHEIIHKVIKNFDIQIQKRDGELNLDLHAENDTIFADEVHISNVIFNLLDNANKYSPNSPKIEVSSFNHKNNLFFLIKDEGMGISKQEQKKIFDKFYRVSTGNIHDVKGFGLGLSYVKRVVELHNGEISLESKKNKGTTIIIKLENYG